MKILDTNKIYTAVELNEIVTDLTKLLLSNDEDKDERLTGFEIPKALINFSFMQETNDDSDYDDEDEKEDVDDVTSSILHYLTTMCDGYHIDTKKFEIIHDVIKFFIENGAEIDAKNKQGDTPLMLAAQNSFAHMRIKLIQLFIDNKATVNLLNKNHSALYYSLCMGDYRLNKAREDSALLLLKHGAEITPTIEAAFSEDAIFNKVKGKYLEIRVQTLEKQMVALMQEVLQLKKSQNDRDQELGSKTASPGFFQ